jgi:hypothetical protein
MVGRVIGWIKADLLLFFKGKMIDFANITERKNTLCGQIYIYIYIYIQIYVLPKEDINL